MADLNPSPRVRVGVTGLNSAGKTVFLTAIVHALYHRGGIAGVSAVRDGRLKGIARLPAHAEDAASGFPYEANADAITGVSGTPRWPDSTDRVSKAVIALRHTPSSWFTRKLGDRELRVELVDYPGEWLLDVLLAKYDYDEWSRALFNEMETPEAGPEAKAFLNYVNNLEPDDPHDVDRHARTAAHLFRDYVLARREANGRANRLHPGRFLIPGPGMDVQMPVLSFAPLPEHLRESGSHSAIRRIPGIRRTLSLWQTMAERFDGYRRTVVKPFFNTTLSRLDRQIVLVDLLGHLARDGAGVPLLDGELRDLQESMRIGRGWLPNRIAPSIDRVLYASSKADLVPDDQHDALLERMRRAVANASESVRFRGAETRVMTLSALKATWEVDADDAPDRRYVAGRHADGNTYMHFPGSVARARLPMDDDARTTAAPFELERFQPPTGLRRHDAWPHYRLDRVIEFILGDRMA